MKPSIFNPHAMRITLLSIAIILSSLPGCRHHRAIPVRISPDADQVTRTAAAELSAYLSRLYPGTDFSVEEGLAGTDEPVIKLGTPEDLASTVLPTEIRANAPEGSFSVLHAGNTGLIVAHEGKGLLSGVYALLERLGFGFYLSHEAIPGPGKDFSWDAWDLRDEPAVHPRIVFNWHNFMSGCTGWDLADWQSWIRQSARMRYSAVMVHAYGNNPMYSFSFNGLQKPTGYLTSTRKGRDWGAQHVNDVRRLHGGSLFEEAVFGSEAALVPDDQKEAAARDLMQQAFRDAEAHGMDVWFAVDVDTWSANPQELIRTLPESARFSKHLPGQGYFGAPELDFQYVNPDTPEGLEYYKAQVQSIMEAYPEIDVITVWFRRYNPNARTHTAWRSLRPEDFPAGWRTEYRAALRAHPGLVDDPRSPSTFALSKIIKAYQRAVRELDLDVGIATGSWRFEFLPTARLLFPENVPILPLDWNVIFYEDSVRSALAETGREHPLVPIVWAHHDDHRYIGKPYTPFRDFRRLLDVTNSPGFGIIHWTTRPLDLYFKSLAEQVWKRTVNKSPDSTVKDYVGKVFGTDQQALVEYMDHWLHEAPMFGRETRDYFIDPGRFVLGEHDAPPASFMEGCRYRLGLLAEVDSMALSDGGQEMYRYYRGMEQFYMDFIRAHSLLVEAHAALRQGDPAGAADLMSECRPEQALDTYARAIQYGNTTRGEEALVITMNLQWLPDFIDMRQLLRLETLRYNFQPTSHDPLAQASGHYTYFFEPDQSVWLGLGKKELPDMDTALFLTEGSEYDIMHSVAVGHGNLSVPLRTFRGHRLAAGSYQLTIMMPDGQQPAFRIELQGTGDVLARYEVAAGTEYFQTEIDCPGGGASLYIPPLNAELRLSGLVLAPVSD